MSLYQAIKCFVRQISSSLSSSLGRSTSSCEITLPPSHSHQSRQSQLHTSCPRSDLTALYVRWQGCDLREGVHDYIVISSPIDAAHVPALIELHYQPEDITVKEMEYWDDDDLAGDLVRAAVAYFEARQGGERAGATARIPDRTNVPDDRRPAT